MMDLLRDLGYIQPEIRYEGERQGAWMHDNFACLSTAQAPCVLAQSIYGVQTQVPGDCASHKCLVECPTKMCQYTMIAKIILATMMMT